ncbi:hypothetical protein AC249_AIPGENE9556 [Exaiptasia diaphana]|nr:hypothetical protein AC249_AIPGENE9556 [Exaiptasia diaphana]
MASKTFLFTVLVFAIVLGNVSYTAAIRATGIHTQNVGKRRINENQLWRAAFADQERDEVCDMASQMGCSGSKRGR